MLFVATLLLFLPGILGVDYFCIFRHQCGNDYFMKAVMWKFFWKQQDTLYWDQSMALAAKDALKYNSSTPPDTLRIYTKKGFEPDEPRLENKMRQTMQDFKPDFPKIQKLPYSDELWMLLRVQ
ncbi:hypothetical protein OSTOST_04659 [Ostertagia ostertagi]